MKESSAIEVYKLILKEINGLSQDRIDELSLDEIICDPLFEKIKEIN